MSDSGSECSTHLLDLPLAAILHHLPVPDLLRCSEVCRALYEAGTCLWARFQGFAPPPEAKAGRLEWLVGIQDTALTMSNCLASAWPTFLGCCSPG